MNNTIRALSLIAAAVLPVCVHAERGIEDLVTTASRTPLPAPRVGSAVSIVDREFIERRQSVLIADVLQDLPGIAVSSSGGPGAVTQLRVRGSEANHLLVLIDGMIANDPAGGDAFSFEQLTAWDVERIEVVRGPHSALWGSDAVAGVINVITRRDDERPVRAGAFVESGSFDTLNLGGRVGGGLGGLSSDLSASWYETDGENVARVGEEDDGYENLSANWTLNYRPSDALKLGLSLRRTDTTSEFDETVSTGLPRDADLVTEAEIHYLGGYAEASVAEGRWKHGLQLSLFDSDRTNLDDGELTNEQRGERRAIYYQTSWDFTARPNQYRLTAAIDYDEEEFEQRYPGLGGAADQRQERHSTGLVAELLARPVDALNLALSVRHDDNSDFEDKTSYRVSVAYRFDDTGTRLRTSYGTGMKKPTFTELFGFFPDSFVGNPGLEPEESDSFDVGVDQRFLEGRGRVGLTWFYAELGDEIRTVFLPGFVSTVENSDGISRRQGVELELDVDLGAGLEAFASYTYTDSGEPDPAGGKTGEIRRPRHMAALNLNYAFLAQRANLNLNLSYTGEQTDRDFSAFPAPLVTLDDYALVNLAASYALGERLSLYARAENLLDEDYENVFGYRTPGTAYYAGVRLRLGR